MRVLIGMDLPTEPHNAYFAAIPMAVRRKGVEVAVEVVVVDEQPFDARLSVARAKRLTQRCSARLVKHLVGLDVHAPRAPARRHRPVRLVGERSAATREVPHRVEDLHARIVQPRDDLARAVVGLPDVHDDFVADVEDGSDGRDDRVVEPDRVPDDGEPGDHVRCGAAGRAAGGTVPPLRTASRGCPAPRSALRRARRSTRRVARWRAGGR